MENKKTMRLRKSSLRVLNQIETKLVGGGTDSETTFDASTIRPISDPCYSETRDGAPSADTWDCPPVSTYEADCRPDTVDCPILLTMVCPRPESLMVDCPQPAYQ